MASKLRKISHDITQGCIPGSLLFLLYTNDLPDFDKNKSKTILFADNASRMLIVTNSNPTNIISDINDHI
jgi:hypothetical protein